MNSRSRRHGKEPSRTEAHEARVSSRVRTLLPVLVGAAAIIVAGLWFGGRLATGGAGEQSNAVAAPVTRTTASPALQTLPQFISSASPRVRDAYDFATGHGAELAFIPCYCGCGGHSGHRDVRDCFIKQQTLTAITYDDHGSGCDICVSIVLDVKTARGQGQSLAATRNYIDVKYSKIGPSTNTPLPPGMEE